MKQSIKGFVLLLSLLLLFIVSAIILASMENTQLQFKMVRSWRSQVNYYLLNQSVLLAASENLLHTHSVICLGEMDLNNDLRDKPASWWQSTAVCHQRIAHYDLAYYIEQQQLLPCAYLVNQKNRVISANGVQFYRITSVALGRYGVSRKLQATVAAPADLKTEVGQDCKSHDKIAAGISSWREIV